MGTMGEITYTKVSFTRFMGLIYLMAFSSLYFQVPASEDCPLRGGNLISPSLCIAPLFFLLWLLYLSVYKVGQVFLHFQWDILLLEVGLLTAIVAAWTPRGVFRSNPWDRVNMWLVRWLLFRLMFAAGVVKLQSGCPTWWGLTALNYHYESQCIPTPLAWYAHQLPDWMQKLSVVGTFLIEIPIPLLFFAPVRSLRIFAFYSQVLLQVAIILTGNYNFFNVLTLVLCLSLVDDEWLLRIKAKGPSEAFLWRMAKLIMILVCIGGLVYIAVVFFSVSFVNGIIFTKITFTEEEFGSLIEQSFPLLLIVGGIHLAWTILHALKIAWLPSRNKGFRRILRKAYHATWCLVYCLIAIFLFGISCVPFSVLHRPTQLNLPKPFQDWYLMTQPWDVSHSYGLFRTMTGVGGRPEITIEGSDSETGPWREIHFKYKPGDLMAMPPFVAPHQPRLDWQMWFAALSSYQSNPWFVVFVHRLLEGEPSVLKLLDEKKYPFKHSPPKFIRATSWLYHYTSWKQKLQPQWWKRDTKSEYFPPIKAGDKTLVKLLKQEGLSGDPDPRSAKTNPLIPRYLALIRLYLESFEPHLFVWILVLTGLLLNATNKTFIGKRR
ncbi:unnamed protein product [Darwinula stevensoni]|uniref:Lipase maturation factor n=1 Tax=Darwinula stevensoni TaxID=69355 RepID=A0A7R9A1A9_9CRUS|nr:unnamed protein product [Darwinula stevensoni]CAG0886263.1 unnamed protein product [Darwinula stevensoni]